MGKKHTKKYDSDSSDSDSDSDSSKKKHHKKKCGCDDKKKKKRKVALKNGGFGSKTMTNFNNRMAQNRGGFNGNGLVSGGAIGGGGLYQNPNISKPPPDYKAMAYNYLLPNNNNNSVKILETKGTDDHNIVVASNDLNDKVQMYHRKDNKHLDQASLINQGIILPRSSASSLSSADYVLKGDALDLFNNKLTEGSSQRKKLNQSFIQVDSDSDKSLPDIIRLKDKSKSLTHPNEYPSVNSFKSYSKIKITPQFKDIYDPHSDSGAFHSVIDQRHFYNPDNDIHAGGINLREEFIDDDISAITHDHINYDEYEDESNLEDIIPNPDLNVKSSSAHNILNQDVESYHNVLNDLTQSAREEKKVNQSNIVTPMKAATLQEVDQDELENVIASIQKGTIKPSEKSEDSRKSNTIVKQFREKVETRKYGNVYEKGIHPFTGHDYKTYEGLRKQMKQDLTDKDDQYTFSKMIKNSNLDNKHDQKIRDKYFSLLNLTTTGKKGGIGKKYVNERELYRAYTQNRLGEENSKIYNEYWNTLIPKYKNKLNDIYTKQTELDKRLKPNRKRETIRIA